MITTTSHEKLSEGNGFGNVAEMDQFHKNAIDDGSKRRNFKLTELPNRTWNILKNIKAEPIMGLFGLGFYMPIPFVQNLVIEKVCMAQYPIDFCLNQTNSTIEKETQDIAAQYLLMHYLVRQLPAVILSLLMGSWSDVYGRKYVIQASLIGNILSFILYLLNYYYMEWPAEYIIFAGIPAGLTGDYAAFMLGIFGFIKDENFIQDLSAKISTADGIELLSSQVGPLIGAQLFSRFSYPSVFFIGIVFHILAMIITFFIVTDKNFEITSWSKMCRDFFRIRGFLESLKSVVKKREDNKRAYILGVLATSMVIFFAYFGHSEIMYMYSRVKLKWDVVMYSYYNLTLGGFGTIGTLILMPLMLRFFNFSDITFGLIGHVGFMAFYLGTAFADDSLSMFLVCILQIIGTMSFVTLRSCISKCVSSSEIGRIMSMYAVLQALTRNLGQIISTQIYVATLKTFVGAFFVFAGALFIINMAIYGWIFRDMKRRNFILNEQITEGSPDTTMDIIPGQILSPN